MAFRVPTFNVWVEVLDDHLLSIGWSICQIRGPVNGVFDLEQTATPTSCVILWEVLFPKGSDVRTRNCTGTRPGVGYTSQWDVLRVCGSKRISYIVQSVGDKGAGFSNEYRLVYVSGHADDILDDDHGLPRINTAFLPPGGYTPLPIIGVV